MAHIREIDLRVDQECVGYISNDCTEDSFLGVEKLECPLFCKWTRLVLLYFSFQNFNQYFFASCFNEKQNIFMSISLLKTYKKYICKY